MAAAQVLSGNLEVSLTTLPWLGNVRVREFASNQEVEDAVLASSCIIPTSPVFLPGLGQWGIDGGYSDFQILKAGGPLLPPRAQPSHAARQDVRA